jgi:formylmethanofuran:tetrahydromethanopterin formyltransferase
MVVLAGVEKLFEPLDVCDGRRGVICSFHSNSFLGVMIVNLERKHESQQRNPFLCWDSC